MDDLKGRQELYNGFGDALARGFELAVMPFIFGGLGFLLDRTLGIVPVFTIALTVFSLVGLGVRAYYGYEREMQAHEANAPWGRARTSPDAAEPPRP